VDVIDRYRIGVFLPSRCGSILYLSCRLCHDAAMTPVRARLALLAIMALFLATAGNALFLQERARTPATTWAGSIPAEKPTATSSSLAAASEPAASPSPPQNAPPHDAQPQNTPPQEAQPRDVQPAAQPAPAPLLQPTPPQLSLTQSTAENAAPRFLAALQRELGRHGYAEQLRTQANGLRLAVLAYEFDSGMPLTGQPTGALLKQVIFDLNQAPRGAFADRAEANQRLVVEIQKALLGLGFFRGALSGRMDVWTSDAVRDFERHRALRLTGRLTEATLLELIAYSGQPLQLSAN
jgi:hypothetical protein